jgi:hypothetical protein
VKFVRTTIIGFCCVGLTTAGLGSDDFLDRVDDALTTSAFNHAVRARLSGTLDLEGYSLQQPAPSLIYTDGRALFNPRLSLFLDAQLGPRLYFYAQSRVDRGFDPGDGGARLRLDEYALRFTPANGGRLSFQIGKFATFVGNWPLRHGSWDNPFITAPLPYTNLTGIWDIIAARTTDQLFAWASVTPAPSRGGDYLFKERSVPVVWGPSYATGAAIFGQLGKFNYAVELKNTSLSSRPETWDADRAPWQHPTWSGRVGFQPNPMWSLGVSASAGTYLQPLAAHTLAPGTTLDGYRETVIAQDVSFAWHHVQLWAECYETSFNIPRVGSANTFAYYVETKLKLTPQSFLALRWNQQLFSRLSTRTGTSIRWGRDVWRVDFGPGYRFTPHIQFKLQYSLQHESADMRDLGHMVAGQFTVRF